MIAQKIVYAKHSEEPRNSLISLTNSFTSTSGASYLQHIPSSPGARLSGL